MHASFPTFSDFSKSSPSLLDVAATIGVSQRLTGWVAAHKQTIVNSDAGLDVPDLAPGSCFSTPLVKGDRLIGVWTVYASAPAAFAEVHRRLVQVVSPHLARTLAAACAADTEARKPVTAPPLRPTGTASRDLRVVFTR